MKYFMAAAIFLALCIVAAGCGSSASRGSGGGGPGGAVSGPSSQAPGPLIVETAASADYKSLTLAGGPDSQWVFTGIYGCRIVRLEYRPAPGRLAGVRQGSTTAHVFTSRPNGGAAAVITPPTPLTQPLTAVRFSPDGNTLAVVKNGELFVCRRDGGGLQRVVVSGIASVGHVAWSADGSTIYGVFARPGGQVDIGSVHVPGRWGAQAAFLWDDPDEELDLDVSPDGGRMVWTRREPGQPAELWMGRIDTTPAEAIQLTVTDTEERWPRWSPDGRYIAYWISARSATDIAVYDTYTGAHRLLTNGGNDAYPAWSADSLYVLFCRGDDLYRIHVSGSPGDEELLAADWGTALESWTPAPGRWRVLVGPAGSDWGGDDPPFGVMRRAAIVAYSARQLAGAVTFSAPAGESVALKNRSPETGGAAVVFEARAGHLQRVLMDNGPGAGKTVWDLRDETDQAPGAVLLIFNPASGRLTSAIPVWDQAMAAAQGASTTLRAADGRLEIGGAPMRVYDGHGRRLTAGSVHAAVIDLRTGRLLEARQRTALDG